jgi:hypothetical protein
VLQVIGNSNVITKKDKLRADVSQWLENKAPARHFWVRKAQ